MPVINTSAIAFQAGTTALPGQGQESTFTFAGTWATGDAYTVILTDNSTAVQTQVGAGFVSGIVPTFTLTFDDKVYVLAGPTVYTSAINLPTTWNDPNAIGNGFVTLSNWYASAEPLVAMAPYQGYMAFFARRTIQIWSVQPLIDNWNKIQTLANIGTLSALSVQPMGDLDVLFLSDTGFRSLKVRDSSLNAFVNDIGSPLDSIIQAALLADDGSTSCGVVDPESGRYWCYLNGVIYVLSFFPSSKIVAWSTYQPTYQNGMAQASFVPQKFIIFQGQVYCLGLLQSGSLALFQFGGSNNNTYDNATATLQTPFMDCKKPGDWKVSKGVDLIMTGSWDMQASMDYIGNSYTEIGSSGTPTNDTGTIGFPATGTHFSFMATCSDATSAPNQPKLSSLLWHFEMGDETA